MTMQASRILSGSHASTSPRGSLAAGTPRLKQPQLRVHATNSDVKTQGQSCKLYDLHDHLVPYQQAWDWQHLLVKRCINAATAEPRQEGCSLLLLQHPPVYTLGAGSTEDNLLFDPAASSIPLYRTERGGEVTYHGPGQLVMYPILDLQHLRRADLHQYMRDLEQVVIQALDEVSGLQGGRVDGMTGVWVQGHKLAAIGIRAKRWVTYHGLALNVVTDLKPFRSIVPCGIANRPVGSVSSMTTYSKPADEDQLLREYRYALLDAFQEIFGVELQIADAAKDLPGAAVLVDGHLSVPLSI